MPGAEGFFLGLAHPVTEPLQGLCAAAAAMLCARFDGARAGQGFLALAGAGLAGLASGLLAFGPVAAVPAVTETSLLIAAAACAGLVAALQRPPFPAGAVLVAVAGGVCGFNTLPEPGEGFVPTLLGSYAGLLLAGIYLAGAGLWLKRREASLGWLHLVPRIAGAWIVAIAVLVLAFQLRGG